MSLNFFTPFDKYSNGFCLIHLEINFSFLKYFHFEFVLFGFGFSFWWYPHIESDGYETIHIEPDLYKSIFELTKYNSIMVIDDLVDIRNDYNQLYCFSNSGSYILKPKIK